MNDLESISEKESEKERSSLPRRLFRNISYWALLTLASAMPITKAEAITPARAREIVTINILCDLVLENQYWSSRGVEISPDFLVNRETTEQGNGTYLCPGWLCDQTAYAFMNVEFPFTPAQINEMNSYSHPWIFLNAASYSSDQAFYTDAKAFWDQYVSNTTCPALPTTNVDGQAPRFFNLTNAPNPFSMSTLISYTLENQSPVKVDIYNAAGQQLKTLVDETQSQGRHDLVWDGKDGAGTVLGSGVFFYTVETPSQRTSKKMLLIR
ncbi:MAG: FlgD immunoglobulin-like domain containing protein [Nanoarchaeota archaeon]